MVIAVLQRRGGIGLRCALGATRGHIRDQFVAEALVLSGLGGFSPAGRVPVGPVEALASA